MQPYNPYLGQQMMTQSNYQPMYGNPYANIQSNIQPTYQPAYQQSVQQPSQQNFKVVDSIEVVKATDIPMDGGIYYFPQADGTTIYSKRWLSNGTTQIMAYKPILDDKATNLPTNEEKSENEPFNAFRNEIMQRLDNIEKALKPATKKKEVATNE